MIRIGSCCLVPAAWFFLAAGLGAQPSETFVDTLDVQVVEVDVVVVDRKGRPVNGLEREDFELVVDGERVEIVNFLEWSSWAGGVDAPRSDASDDSRQPPIAERSPPSGPPLLVAIYIDELRLRPSHRTRVLSQLEAAVEPWRALGANFMLATFDDKLQIPVGPTTDLQSLLDAPALRDRPLARAVHITAARRRTLTELVEVAGGQSTVSDVGGTAGAMERCRDDAWFNFMAIARNHAYQVESASAVAMDGLVDLINALSGLPGRKAVVYVSDGLPQRPGVDMFTYIVEQLCPDNLEQHPEAYMEMLQFDDASPLNRVAAHANSSRVTFFPLDAQGLAPGLYQDPSFRNTAEAPSPRNDEIARMNRQNGLNVLAHETGGRALFNSNDIASSFAEVAERLASSYSLGFRPEVAKPGETRQIRVELAPHAAKRRRVHYRRSYRDKSLDERLAERLFSVAYLGAASNPLDATIHLKSIGDPPDGKDDVQEVAVEVAVPDAAIVRLPGGDDRQRILRLWLLAVEPEKGIRTQVRQKLMVIDEDDASALMDGAWRYEVAMNLLHGDYRVAVGIRDELTGVTSLLRESLSVPAAPEKQ